MTLKELNDGLQLARIRKKALNKQAGELRKLHLRECLIQEQIKKQPTKIQAIKQRMQQEQSKKVWYLMCVLTWPPGGKGRLPLASHRDAGTYPTPIST